MSAVSDPFERFAAECEPSVAVEPLSVAPRDVLASPADADECFLVTLTGPRPETGPIRLLIVVPPKEKRPPPTVRDALCWLAADAWAIERTEGNMERWASMYDYPVQSAATARLFERQVRQTETLRALPCGGRFQQLLELYEGQVSASGEVGSESAAGYALGISPERSVQARNWASTVSLLCGVVAIARSCFAWAICNAIQAGWAPVLFIVPERPGCVMTVQRHVLAGPFHASRSLLRPWVWVDSTVAGGASHALGFPPS
jgi:hypothetical protein